LRSKRGFKSLDLENIIVIASERHALGNVALQVGDMKSVKSPRKPRNCRYFGQWRARGLVSGTQLNDLALKGRAISR
jgi:hypothetical protein